MTKSESSIRAITISRGTVAVLGEWRLVTPRTVVRRTRRGSRRAMSSPTRSLSIPTVCPPGYKALKSRGLRHTAVRGLRHLHVTLLPGTGITVKCRVRPPRIRLHGVHTGPLHQGHRPWRPRRRPGHRPLRDGLTTINSRRAYDRDRDVGPPPSPPHLDSA